MSEAQAQNAYMNRQTDKVIDKIMEMEPKSAHNPVATQPLEGEPMDRSYRSKRSHANTDLDKNFMN